MTDFLNKIPGLAYATIPGSKAYSINLKNSDIDICCFFSREEVFQ